MNTYCASAIGYESAGQVIHAGREQISENGELSIDAGALEDGNTLAVCAMIEWRREAMRKNCRLEFVNIPPRIKKLIAVYRLEELLPSSSPP